MQTERLPKAKRAKGGTWCLEHSSLVLGWPVVSPRGWLGSYVGPSVFETSLRGICGYAPKDGYKRYYRKEAECLWFHGEEGPNAWRVLARQTAEQQGWTCFYRACLEILPEAMFGRMMVFVRNNLPMMLRAGLTPHMASVIFAQCNIPYSVAMLPFDGRFVVVNGVNGLGGFWGVCLVMVDDDGAVEPHWLPFTNLNLWHQTPMKDHEILQGRNHPSPHVSALAAATALAAGPAMGGPAGAWLPAAPAAPPRILNMSSIMGYVGVTAPPSDPNWADDFFGRSRKFWRLSGKAGSPGFVPIDGEPTWLDVAISLTDDIGLCWELRPGVVDKMVVGEDSAVYWLDGPVHSQDPRLLANGCFNPDRIVTLDARQSTWVLGPRQAVQVGERLYWVSKLVRGAWTVMGRFVYNAGLTEAITGASFLEDDTFSLPAERDFPTRQAYVRAVYTKLSKLVLPEEVGPLLDQRNATMAYMADHDDELPPGFTPEANARALASLGKILERRMGVNLAGVEAFTVA